MLSSSVRTSSSEVRMLSNISIFWQTIETRLKAQYSMPLQWRELPQYKESQIYIGPQPADFTQRGQWPEYYTWLAGMIEAYSRVFGPRIRHLQPDQSAAPKGTPEGIELSLGEPVDAH